MKATFKRVLPIKNVFNESYSRDISRKVQSSFKAMQYAGLFTGAYCSYGYFIHQTHIRHFKIRKMDYGQNLLNILQTVTLRKLRQQFERKEYVKDRCGRSASVFLTQSSITPGRGSKKNCKKC